MAAATLTVHPWGYADANDDFSLTYDELDQLPDAIKSYDLNGDSIVTLSEVTRSKTTEAENMMGGSMLSITSAIELPSRQLSNSSESRVATSEEENKETSQAAKEILQHYTFLSTIEREVWPGWSDERWNEIDQNQDQKIDSRELETLLLSDPDLQIAVRLPAASMREGVHFGANAGFGELDSVGDGRQASWG